MGLLPREWGREGGWKGMEFCMMVGDGQDHGFIGGAEVWFGGYKGGNRV